MELAPLFAALRYRLSPPLGGLDTELLDNGLKHVLDTWPKTMPAERKVKLRQPWHLVSPLACFGASSVTNLHHEGKFIPMTMHMQVRRGHTLL